MWPRINPNDLGIMLPNPSRTDFTYMTIGILEIDTLPSKVPVHSSQNAYTTFLEMRMPILYILWCLNSEAEMLI